MRGVRAKAPLTSGSRCNAWVRLYARAPLTSGSRYDAWVWMYAGSVGWCWAGLTCSVRAAAPLTSGSHCGM